MVGGALQKPWGLLTCSRQDVGPLQWMDHSRQLMAQYSRQEAHKKLNVLVALVKVMERLSCYLPMDVGDSVNEVVPGILEFNEAFRIYSESIEAEVCDIEKLKVTFQNQLLNHVHGLPVFIISHKLVGKYVILRSSSNSIEYILSTLLDALEEDKDESENMEFSISEIKSLMSSDFDRKLLELAVSFGKSKRELEILNINVASTTEEVKKLIDEI
jgi:antitoxin component HigA of HigAB toxin-antitoxin module